jgi:hypothetical protein
VDHHQQVALEQVTAAVAVAQAQSDQMPSVQRSVVTAALDITIQFQVHRRHTLVAVAVVE